MLPLLRLHADEYATRGAEKDVFESGPPTPPASLSDDGKYFFVGLDGSKSVARFNIETNAVDLTFSLGTDAYSQSLTPAHLSVAPGNPNLLAISTSSWTGIGIWDISGNTATRRPTLSGPYNGDFVQFADSTHVYSVDASTTGAEFYRWNVTSNGVSKIDDTSLVGIAGYWNGPFTYVPSAGLVFGTGGGIANPSTTPPSMVGETSGAGWVAPDTWNSHVFYLSCPIATGCSGLYGIQAYDLNTLRPSGSITFSGSYSVDNLIRWGRDGLAFRQSVLAFALGFVEIYRIAMAPWPEQRSNWHRARRR